MLWPTSTDGWIPQLIHRLASAYDIEKVAGCAIPACASASDAAEPSALP